MTKFKKLLRDVQAGGFSAAGRVASKEVRTRILADARAALANQITNLTQQRAALNRAIFCSPGSNTGKLPKFSMENASEAVNTKGLPSGLRRLHAYNHTAAPGSTPSGIRGWCDHLGGLDGNIRLVQNAIDELAAA